MRNSHAVQPTPATEQEIVDREWTPRGLAALELAPPPVLKSVLLPRPRDAHGRFRSTHSDIAFAAA